MEMVYRNDTLYINMIGSVGVSEINDLKEKLFLLLNQYQVDNVVINLRDSYGNNKKIFNSFLREYHRNYKGNIIIDI